MQQSTNQSQSEMKKITRYFIKRLRYWLQSCETDYADQDSRFTGTIVEAENKDLINIGQYVSFGGKVLLYANAPISIGDGCMIARGTKILTSTHDHHVHPMWRFRIDRPVKIGSHVWIGLAAIILPGVIIEDYAVIAAGSVVTANVPRGSIVAGNPAMIIGQRDPNVFENSQYDIKSDYPGKIIKKDFKMNYCKKI